MQGSGLTTGVGRAAAEVARQWPSITAPDGPTEVETLLSRMRTGDREAAAEFVTRYGTRLRRRIRGKLSPSMRRIFDSQEILSTVGRRLDIYVQAGRLEAENVDQLWSLVCRMMDNAVVDKARVFRRLRRVEDEDGPFAQDLLDRLQQADESHRGVEIEIEKALTLFDDRIDREILSLWLIGTRHCDIAVFVDLSPMAVRQRWRKIKLTLQERFASDVAG